jgi:hypothetical protein
VLAALCAPVERLAGVGRLTDARAIVEGRAGTRISNTIAPNLPR